MIKNPAGGSVWVSFWLEVRFRQEREYMGKRFIYAYEMIEDVIACIGLIFGVGIMFIGIVARYVFDHPLTFVDEIAPIFIVWSTFAGYSIALRNDEHIKMDILYISVKSGKIKKMMDIFSHFCGTLFSAFIAVYGFKAMLMQHTMKRVTQILEFPVWITYLVIPFGGMILVIRYADLLIRGIRNHEQEGR